MPCPICGGSSRRPLAQGLFECTSAVTTTVPNRQHPSLGPELIARPCGNRYQESDGNLNGATLCFVCDSISAIGFCTVCRRPLDGFHGKIATDGLLCPDHYRERTEARATARVVAEQEEGSRAEAALNSLPNDEYLQQVAVGHIRESNREATGADIARALRSLNSSGYWVDREGGLGVGSRSDGCGLVIRPSGEVIALGLGRWTNSLRTLSSTPGSHTYSANETAEMLVQGMKCIRSISSRGN